MRITWNELTVGLDGVDLDGLLHDWRWLVGEEFRPVVVSAIGDAFLRRDDGRIFWLDAGWGRLTEAAADADEFKQRMVQQENAEAWFSPQLVGDLLAAGVRLAPGQCFGYKTPPVLGGGYEQENFEPTDLQVHFGVLGQIHEQVKDLPPGTRIDGIKIE